MAAEYGLVTVRRTRMAELEEQGNRRAGLVIRITTDPPRFITAMQLGVTLTSLGIGALGEQALTHALRPVCRHADRRRVAFLIITFFHVVIGELVPKGVALGHSERTALRGGAPGARVLHVFHPFIWVLSARPSSCWGVRDAAARGRARGATRRPS